MTENATTERLATICEKKFAGRGRRRRCTEVVFHPAVTAFEKIGLMLTASTRHWTRDNEYAKPEWANDTFDTTAEYGRSYMVGTGVSMDDYQKSHSSYIARHHWLAYAVEWAFENPNSCLCVEIPFPCLSYRISRRGNSVEIALPYHDAGGERHWIVYPDNHRKRLLVNVD